MLLPSFPQSLFIYLPVLSDTSCSNQFTWATMHSVQLYTKGEAREREECRLTLSKLVRFPLPSSIPKAMKQITAATHMRHWRPPASCLANFTYSGVPLGGFSSLRPSLSKTSRANEEVKPCGWSTEQDTWKKKWTLKKDRGTAFVLFNVA